jgi:hypothetical protein
MVGGRERGRLDHEDVCAPHVLEDLDENLHVSKAADHCLGQGRPQVGADRFRKPRIGVAGDELDRSVLGLHRRLLSPMQQPFRAALAVRPKGCRSAVRTSALIQSIKSAFRNTVAPAHTERTLCGAVISRRRYRWQYDVNRCPVDFGVALACFGLLRG